MENLYSDNGRWQPEMFFETTVDFLAEHQDHRLERIEAILEDGQGALIIFCLQCQESHVYDLISKENP